MSLTLTAIFVAALCSVLNLYFLNRIQVGGHGRNRDEVVHDGDAVQGQAVGDLPGTGTDEILPRWSSGEVRLRPDNHIRSGRSELQRIATV